MPVMALAFSALTATAQNNNAQGNNAQNNQEAMKKLMESPLRKLQIAEFAITNLYVDSIDEKKLVEDAIVGMLK